MRDFKRFVNNSSNDTFLPVTVLLNTGSSKKGIGGYADVASGLRLKLALGLRLGLGIGLTNKFQLSCPLQRPHIRFLPIVYMHWIW